MKEELLIQAINNASGAKLTTKSEIIIYYLAIILCILFAIIMISISVANRGINFDAIVILLLMIFTIIWIVEKNKVNDRNSEYLKKNKEAILRIKDTSINDLFIKYNLNKINFNELKYTLENKYEIGKEGTK